VANGARRLRARRPASRDGDRNGPGIVTRRSRRSSAKLLYGSKFHRLRMSGAKQGIGISAAGMYAQLTTGKPVQIISRTGARAAPILRS